MSRGSKAKYSDKQKRKAEHIEEGYEDRGVSDARGRSAGLGHRQQGERRRQQERIGARQARHQSRRAQRRTGRRPCRRAAQPGRQIRVRAQGRPHTQGTRTLIYPL